LDSATYVDTIELTHKIDPPPGVLLAKGPQIVESVLGGPLHTVKPARGKSAPRSTMN
jgi:hypothetical protein